MRVAWAGRGAALFPQGIANAAGNNLPAVTGARWDLYKPGPGGARHLGAGGEVGGFDGFTGADPRAPKVSPRPVFLPGDDPAGMDSGVRNNAPSFVRYGIQGYNDQLTVKDRHAYWDSGNQKTGVTFDPASANSNTYNNPLEQPPFPELRLVNRTVSYQKGSDATRNQDDLTRQYTWLGEQGSGWTPVYGGVPGLYQPYGTRGGVPYPIVSPAAQGQEGDGPRRVWSGPPHGLHSRTPWKGGAQIIRRYLGTPQMRPVRFDRPSNSPQAGQSYSQTVRPQGASRVRPAPGQMSSAAPGQRTMGRGWAGRGD